MGRKRKPVEGIETVSADGISEEVDKALFMHRNGMITTRQMLDWIMNGITGALTPTARKSLFGALVAVAYIGLVTTGVVEDPTGGLS